MKFTAFTLFFSLFFSIGFAQDCLEGNCNDGWGIYIFEDKSIYIGYFEENQFNGWGTLYNTDGYKYTGFWENHHFSGQGVMTFSDRTYQAGMWKESKLVEEMPNLVPKENKSEFPSVYAVVVGVADYDIANMEALSYTDDDAKYMDEFFRSPEGGSISQSNINVLIDEDATKANIIMAMHRIYTQASPNDVVMFYFSGHGLRNSLLPIDYNGGNDKELFHKEILNIINLSPAKNKICLVDACHASNLVENDTEFMQDMSMVLKGEEAEDQMLIYKYYNEFRKVDAGTVFLLSSKGTESSIETGRLRHGVFTHFIIEGLKGAADTNYNDIVTVLELSKYVRENVKTYTNNFQNPVLIGQFDENTPIGMVRD